MQNETGRELVPYQHLEWDQAPVRAWGLELPSVACGVGVCEPGVQSDSCETGFVRRKMTHFPHGHRGSQPLSAATAAVAIVSLFRFA